MMIEEKVWKILYKSEELNNLMNKQRGNKFSGKFPQGIFTFDIPETPTNFKKRELAPFMRINPTFTDDLYYFDDNPIANEQRVKVEFWCRTIPESEAVTELIDKLMFTNGFERYTANERPRFKDNDIDLIMNVRKYRFFDFKKINEDEDDN